MKSKTMKIWGVLALLFLLLVITYLCVSIYTDIKKNTNDISLSFTNLSIDTTNNAELNGFMSDVFINQEKEMILKTPNLKVVLISGANGLEFAYPSDSFLLEYSTGIPKIKTKSPLINIKASALPISGLRNCTITCLYDVSNIEHIFRYSRNAFLAILSIILGSLLILISSKLNKDSSSINTSSNKEPENNNDFKFTSDLLKDLNEFDYDKTADNFSNSNKNSTHVKDKSPIPSDYDPIEDNASISSDYDPIEDSASIPSDYDPIEDSDFSPTKHDFNANQSSEYSTTKTPTEEQFNIDNLEDTNYNQNDTKSYSSEQENIDDIDDIYAPLKSFEQLKNDKIETPYEESLNEISKAKESTEEYLNINDEPQKAEQSMPQGLFSPSTGLGWEQYLEERLNSEISRAAQNEQDLALVLFRLKFLKRTDGLFRKIISKSIEIFNFKDQIFEYGTDGIAIIVANTSLDKIMQNCEELYKRIFELFTENEYKNEIGIGISLRASRLISANRLITEASNACEKAIEEPELPIVAFRADPEKYRSFLTNQ